MIGDFFGATYPFGRLSVYDDGSAIVSLAFLWYGRRFHFAPCEVGLRRFCRSGAFYFKSDATEGEVIFATFHRQRAHRVLESLGYSIVPMPVGRTRDGAV